MVHGARAGLVVTWALLLGAGCSASPVGDDPCAVCDPNATCTVPSSWEEVVCTCDEAFWGDGRTCIPDCAPGEAGCCGAPGSCPDRTLCELDTGTCRPRCRGDADCAGIRPDCSETPCVCEREVCRPAPCTSDGDCDDGLLCAAGACAVSAPAADACELIPSNPTLIAGEARVLRVLASYGGAGVAPGGGWSFRSSAPDLLSVGPDGRVRALGRSGTATVTATRGEVRCEAEVRTVAEVAAPDVQVALVETDTLRPVAGATVVVAVEGMPHRQAVSAEDGTARFDDIEAEVFDLHVFAPVPEDGSPGRAYVSVIGTHTRNLLLEVPPDELPDHLGGIQGEVTMEALHGDPTADSGVALSGLSVPELDGRLPERLLAGYEVEANATCDHESKTVPIGSEWSIVHSGTLQKSAFVALGRPGPRIAWALGRQDTVFLGSTVCGQSNVIGNLLEWYAYDLFPEYPFPRLSSVGPRVEVGLADADRLGHAPDLTDTLAFPVVRPEFSAQRMVSLTLAGDDGALPSLMVGGTFVPQLGLVPLGLAAPSPFQEAPLLRLAPLHGGLEGGGYVLLYLARDGSYGWSARLIHRDHLVAGERIEVPPLLPQPSRYRPSDETDRALIVRAPDAGTAFRAVLTDRDGRMWSVQHARREQILLPYPAQFTCGQGPCGDRFGFERAEAFVLDAPLDALVRRGGLHAGDLLGQVRAFSTSR